HRPHPGLWVKRVGGLVAFDARGELVEEFFIDAVEHEHALDGQAGLPVVVVATDGTPLGRFFDVGVVAHDHRIAAAQFQRHPFQHAPAHFANVPAGGRFAGECDATHLRVLDQFFAHDAAGTADAVD